MDVAASLRPADLARAVHEASIRHRVGPSQVEEVLRQRLTSPGAKALRRILHGDTHVTLSGLERRFLSILRAHRLPLPDTNVVAGAWRVDCRWCRPRLIVELDGYRFHRSRHAWERDRRRERDARAAGYEFRRFTYGDVREDPRLMLAELRSLLAGGAS